MYEDVMYEDVMSISIHMRRKHQASSAARNITTAAASTPRPNRTQSSGQGTERPMQCVPTAKQATLPPSLSASLPFSQRSSNILLLHTPGNTHRSCPPGSHVRWSSRTPARPSAAPREHACAPTPVAVSPSPPSAPAQIPPNSARTAPPPATNPPPAAAPKLSSPAPPLLRCLPPCPSPASRPSPFL
jgi:hypothetical protein